MICELRKGLAPGCGDGFRGVSDQGGFAALAAMGDGSEVGRVGFDHEASRGALDGGLQDLGGLLEGRDAGE